METTYICAECLIRQVREACDLAFEEWEPRQETMLWAIDKLQNTFQGATPTLLGTEIHRMVKSASSAADPYKAFKKKSNEVARQVFDELASEVKILKDALVVAATANAIDAAIAGYTDFEAAENLARLIRGSLQAGLAIDESKKLEDVLQDADSILYLTDNCGEIVFDKFVLKQLVDRGKTVIISPKEEPILNDATVEDVTEVGLDEYGAVIPHTRDSTGLTVQTMSEGFVELWDNADLVIAKGMSYYQTLFGVRENIAFLLRANCEPVARSLNVKKGDNVLLF
jgi:hypothetical protein